MLSQEQRECGEAWGLPQEELDSLAERLAHELDGVCQEIRARLPESARDTLCHANADVSVAHSGQLVLTVSAAWWPTGDGGDDLLEIVCTVTWPREISDDVVVDCDASVTEWGSLFPYAEEHVRCVSPITRVTAVAALSGFIGRSLDGREGELADAILRLKRHGGRWPDAR